MSGASGKNGLSLADFAELFERETSFDLMDQDGRSVTEHIDHNIQWFRDWAEETARGLEKEAERVEGYDADGAES